MQKQALIKYLLPAFHAANTHRPFQQAEQMLWEMSPQQLQKMFESQVAAGTIKPNADEVIADHQESLRQIEQDAIESQKIRHQAEAAAAKVIREIRQRPALEQQKREARVAFSQARSE